MTGTDLTYTLNELDEMYVQAHAMASPLRLRIIKLLAEERSLYINEIAERLGQPPSTIALNVRVLDQAGLIVTEVQPGTRGGIRRCSPVVHSIGFRFGVNTVKQAHVRTADMPLGGYSNCEIEPVCGIADANGVIGQMHQSSAFFMPERFGAQLLWFTQGYVEYLFPRMSIEGCALRAMELSFEACSEAPYYCEDWPSDISIWLNGVKLGTWHCPGDFGGRQGKLTPEWWDPKATQFGQLKTWTVTSDGTTLDWMPISDIGLDALNIGSAGFIRLRIGIEKDAPCIGGINLFGERFGDYPQGLRMKYFFEEK